MKKFISYLLIGSLVLSCIGCGQTNNNNHVRNEKETSTATSKKEEDKGNVLQGSTVSDSKEANGNLIPFGDFSEESTLWGSYLESGGQANQSINSSDELEVLIYSTGSVAHGVQVYCDGFELKQNAKYKISFDIKSTVKRHFDWRIQINGGDYHPYIMEEKLPVETSITHVEKEFTMQEPTDPAPRFCINLGNQKEDGELPEHTVTIDNVSLLLLDDSTAIEVKKVELPMINMNQIGYRPSDKKIAYFRDEKKDASFKVIDTNSKKEVYTGTMQKVIVSRSAKENVAQGDFSAVTTPGTYHIELENGNTSANFTIGDDVYQPVFESVTKMLYLQRCGMTLTKEFAGDFAHEACDLQDAILYGTKKTKSVTGGWHDAGDYGRYVVAGAKAVADILLAYENYHTVFSDNTNIPESGNGIPDVLDEARYELDWMLKMQDGKSGGVYHKVTNLAFPGMVMPDTVKEPLYIMPISNTATGSFSAVMAMASRIYKDVDKNFSKTCLAASKKALHYLETTNDKSGFENPDDVLTGEYPDPNCADEHLWALCELYKTTKEQSYNKKIVATDTINIPASLGWQGVGVYAYYAYLTAQNQNQSTAETYKEILKENLDDIVKIIEKDGYNSSIKDVYPWGSNMNIANNGMLLLLGSQIFSNKDYKDLAETQVNYLLGANATSYCFITGFGSLSPQHPHHRPSEALEKPMPGMLIGGPDSNLEDPYTKTVLSNTPPAKCYVDSSQSFSTNEITIYWNSPFIYLLAGVLSKE